MIKINNTTKRGAGSTVQIAYIPDVEAAANALCAELSATKEWYEDNYETIDQVVGHLANSDFAVLNKMEAAGDWVFYNSGSYSTLYNSFSTLYNWYDGDDGAAVRLDMLYDWYTLNDHYQSIDAAVDWVGTNYYTLDNIMTWLAGHSDEIDSAVNWVADEGVNLSTSLSVGVNEAGTPTSGYAKTYNITQGGTTVGAIDIPKDFLVKSAALCVVTAVDVPYTGAQVGDKYIDFVINARDASETAEHIYLPVNDLVDVYTAQQNATQVQLAIGSDNVISAAIVAGSIGTTELADSAVVTAKIADANVTTAKIADANVTTAKIANAAVTTDKIGLVDTADSTKSYTLAVTSGRLELVEL